MKRIVTIFKQPLFETFSITVQVQLLNINKYNSAIFTKVWTTGDWLCTRRIYFKFYFDVPLFRNPEIDLFILWQLYVWQNQASATNLLQGLSPSLARRVSFANLGSLITSESRSGMLVMIASTPALQKGEKKRAILKLGGYVSTHKYIIRSNV